MGISVASFKYLLPPPDETYGGVEIVVAYILMKLLIIKFSVTESTAVNVFNRYYYFGVNTWV